MSSGGIVAKRLTDTAKWKNPWFRSLPSKYKILFLYILDECDNAGVMHLDWEIIGFVLKEKFSVEDFNKFFKEKICFIGEDKIIVRKFMLYQDNYDSPMMRKHVEKVLRSHGIWNEYKDGKFS